MIEKLEEAGPRFACALQKALHDVEARSGDEQTDAMYELRSILCEIMLLVGEAKLHGFTVCCQANDLMCEATRALKGGVGMFEAEINDGDAVCIQVLSNILIKSLQDACLKRDFLDAQDTPEL